MNYSGLPRKPVDFKFGGDSISVDDREYSYGDVHHVMRMRDNWISIERAKELQKWLEPAITYLETSREQRKRRDERLKLERKAREEAKRVALNLKKPPKEPCIIPGCPNLKMAKMFACKSCNDKIPREIREKIKEGFKKSGEKWLEGYKQAVAYLQLINQSPNL